MSLTRLFVLTLAAFPLIVDAAPFITPNGVVNSASFAPALSPGGAVAQGSLFSIFGARLGPTTGVQPATFPLGTTVAGVSVKVIQGLTSVDAIPLYVSDTLINAVMPSNAPTGRVSVQVTYNGGQSNMAPVTVAVNAPGIYTATGAGIGPGILQNAISATQVPINSSSVTARPGGVEVLYLTGLGPITAPDTSAPPIGNLPFPVELWVGGQPVTNIAYSGRSPCCSGLDEIVFTLPESASAGCYVPVMVRVAGMAVSNTVTMAIDPNGANCSDALNPFAAPVTQGKKGGVIALIRKAVHSDTGTISDLTTDQVFAAFETPQSPAFFFNAPVALPPAGGCTVLSGTGDVTGPTAPFSSPAAVLDAGSLTLNGVFGSTPFFNLNINGTSYYTTQLVGNSPAVPGSPKLYLNPGDFAITGKGGADVGAFQASVTVPSNLLTWTNSSQISVLDRTQPLTVTWSGQASATGITGGSYNAPNNVSAAFTCIAPAGATSFTVPPWILANLPPSPQNSANSYGFLSLTAATPAAPFTAQGLEIGAAVAVSGQQKIVTIR